jgi:hypothetical protein
MRALAALVVFIALLSGAVWMGSTLASHHPQPPLAEPPSAGTTTEDDTETTGGKPARRKTEPHARAPREHHVSADMEIARKAVLHASDIEAEWVPVRPPRDAPPCRQNDPDLSRFTITGEARTVFESPAGVTRMESRVRVFPSVDQAAAYFDTVNNRAKLRCIRDSTKKWLAENGWRPRPLYARVETDPPIGTQTAMYLVEYAITLSTGRKLKYPVDVLTFQTNRAVGTLQFDFVFSPDGSKPCQCELQEANLVASRLHGT